MTTELLDKLRKLHTQSTDAEDKQLLGAILAAEQAAEGNGKPTYDTQRCAKCKRMLPPGKLNGDGVCGYCLLDALYMRQKNWRKTEHLED